MPSLRITPHYLSWLDGSQKIQPTCIVLHWWGERINDQGVDYLVRILERRQLSVQYAVGVTGEVYQLAPTPDTFCRHAKCANHSAIGIEIEGFDEHDLDANELQFHAVVALVRYLAQTFAMELDFRVEGEGTDMRFFGLASHKQVDEYCEDANSKDDVHDEYVERVRLALSST